MKAFLRGFRYAWAGILYCIRQERNMRFHLCLFTYMFGFLLIHDFFTVTRTQYAILLVMSAMVMCLEIVNTAIERAVDLTTGEIHPLARGAKDAAAAAVLVAAMLAVGVGLVILLQPEAFRKMFVYYKAKPYMLLVLVASLVPSGYFVFHKSDRSH